MAIVTSSTGSQTPETAIANAQSWRQAVDLLIPWLVANSRAFSSGEIAAYLRRYRPDLAFQQNTLGEYVRDQYDNGLFPSYTDAAGNPLYPTQVPRTTTGIATTLDGRKVIGRSPAGISVFVYALDGADGYAHDFEVYIPDWRDPEAKEAVDASAQAALTVAPPVPSLPGPTPATPAIAAPPAPPAAPQGVLITGTLSRADLVATVRKGDLRVQVPRAAFEAWVAATNRPLRGGPQGDPVYVAFLNVPDPADPTGNTKPVIEITRDATPTSQPFHLWVTRGRLALHAAPGFGPFQEGDRYEITVDAAKLTIDLSSKV